MPNITLAPTFVAFGGQVVWNLLFYQSAALAQTDPLISALLIPLPPSPGPGNPNLTGAVVQPVSVFQFGAQSAGYWVMVTCAITDPTSFSAHLALQYIPANNYLNFVNSTFIQDLAGLQIPGFFSNGLPVNSQPSQPTFQLINNLAIGGSRGGLSGSLTNTIHEVWYLFGYPDATTQAANSSGINNVVSQSSGSSQTVTVFASQRFAGSPLIRQPGIWVLARIPSLVDVNGGLVLDANLINQGFMRFIYDFTAKATAITQFNQVSRLQIFDATNTLIFDGAPTLAVTPLSLPSLQDSNAYTPQGLHFDGATGLVVTNALATTNTGKISFAGWFNLDPSLSGTLEFSQGSGNNRLFFDNTLPAPTWCHMMGTIDAGANQAALLINGESASGNPAALGSAFSSAPTNGTNLYIGTDTNGNFYKGDIADLSIWFDYSFIENGVISPQTIARVVLVTKDNFGTVTIQPVNPALTIFGFNSLKQPFQQGGSINNLAAARRPDVFLSGPASTALTPQTLAGTIIQGVHSLTTVSGALTNSSTNPGKITIVPA